MTGLTCDTSVLVPALVSTHPDHDATRNALDGHLSALGAHVLLECYSVLTRLPSPHRFSAGDAGSLLEALGTPVLTLPASRHRALVAALAQHGLRGGAVYDGLVALTAQHHDVRLLTRDRRARATYDAIGVSYSLV